MYSFYDYIARIIRIFLAKKVSMERIYTSNMEKIKTEEEKIYQILSIEEPIDLERLIDFMKEDYVCLLVLMIRLDELAYEKREKQWWEEDLSFEDQICIEGLNSPESRSVTNLVLIPRYSCIWEGKSREEHHRLDINTFLKYSYCIELKDGKINGRFWLKNHILNPQIYGIHMNNSNELYLTVGLSPVSSQIVLKDIKYSEETDGYCSNYFMIDEYSKEEKEFLRNIVTKILLKADKEEIDIFVFPEMLGTEEMVSYISKKLYETPLKNIKFVVLPSIWKKSDVRHKSINFCYVMNCFGDIWYSQGKFDPFPWNDKKGEKYLEDIEPCDTVHMVHCNGLGSAAVVICRSELEEDTRDILIRNLNIKLLLCPSWSTGNFEFETSIMSGAERCSNTVWCNTCSALNEKGQEDKIIGIVSGYGKKKLYSTNSLEGRTFPCKHIGTECVELKSEVSDSGQIAVQNICISNCESGCYFSQKIYGTDFVAESQEEEE